MTADFTTTTTLVDGATVVIRSLRSGDYDAVVRLASELTRQERYQRFFTVYPTYIGEWALSLTMQAEGIVAIGAFECDELIGVANYVTLPHAGDAEIAVVVAHEQHERGVGTLLLRMLGSIARAAGIHRFVADVLAGNHAIRAVIKDAGWPVAQHYDRGVVSVEVNLDDIDRELLKHRSI